MFAQADPGISQVTIGKSEQSKQSSLSTIVHAAPRTAIMKNTMLHRAARAPLPNDTKLSSSEHRGLFRRHVSCVVGTIDGLPVEILPPADSNATRCADDCRKKKKMLSVHCSDATYDSDPRRYSSHAAVPSIKGLVNTALRVRRGCRYEAG